MEDYYALLQKPIPFENDYIKGTLFAIGNTKKNIIQFQVFFEKTEDIIPLLVRLCDSKGMEHCVFLMVKNESELSIKSHMYDPEFLIRKGIKIIEIQPLIKIA